MLPRAAAHEEGNLHVPHGKGQVGVRALVAHEPLRLGQHAVEDAGDALDLVAVADLGRLGGLAVCAFMEEVEPACVERIEKKVSILLAESQV